MTSLGISFGTDGFFYGLVIPLVLIQLIALLLIPALLRSTSRIEDITRAITACIGKTLGALLRMGHQHTFGHGVMYFLTAAVFLFAGWPRRATAIPPVHSLAPDVR